MITQDVSVSAQSGYTSAVGARTAILATASLTLAIGSCSLLRSPEPPQVTASPEPAEVVVSPDSVSLNAIGATRRLTARVLDASGKAVAGAQVSWTTANEDMATVDAGGLVRSIAEGNTVVVATADGVSGTALVVVTSAPVASPEPAEVVVSPDSVSLNAIGATRRLTARVLDASGKAVAGAQVSWTTANEDMATVDAGGLVRSIAEGNTVVVATADGVSGTALVVVTSAPQGRSTRLCWGFVGTLAFGTDCSEVFAYYETTERSPNVQSVTRVTGFSDDRGQVGRPVLSASDELYYAYADDAETPEADLWRQPIVGTGRTRVTTAPGRDIVPSLTDRGTALIFSSNRAGGGALWRINAQGGGGLTRVTEPMVGAKTQSVSPDQAIIAYSAGHNESAQIWTLDRRTGEHRQLGLGYSPEISPDGTKILYSRRNPSTGRWQIWQMNIVGGGDTFISGGSDHHEIHPVWSPSGNSILYASNQGTDANGRQNYDIWQMALGRGTRTQLTTNGSHDDHPIWHTDDRIFFRSNRGGAWNIWYMRATGGLSR